MHRFFLLFSFLVTFSSVMGQFEYDFEIDIIPDSNVCVGEVVYYSVQTSENISHMEYIYEDDISGIPGSNAFALIFMSEGCYTLRFVVSDGINYDTIIKENYPCVHDVEVDFSVSSISDCELPAQIELHGYSTDAAELIWYFENGTATTGENVQWEFEENGIYTVRLYGADSLYNCGQSVSKEIVIGSPQVELFDFSQDTIGLSQSISLPDVDPKGGEFEGPGILDSIFDGTSAGIGEHIITYSVLSDNNCYGIDSTSIVVVNDVGVHEYSNFNISISPNPANDFFTLSSTPLYTENITVVLFDPLGRTVVNKPLTNKNTSIDTQNLTPGIYSVVIQESGFKIASTKIVVIH